MKCSCGNEAGKPVKETGVTYMGGFDLVTGKCWWCRFPVITSEGCVYAREVVKTLRG